MSYSWIFLGDATFPPGALAAWLAACPSGVTFADWPRRFYAYEADATQVEDTTGEVLDFLAGETFSIVERGDDRVRVRTIVDKDSDGWLTYRGALATAFRGVGALGGTATLYAITDLDAEVGAGFLVESSPGAERCVVLSEREAGAARNSAAARELDAVVERST